MLDISMYKYCKILLILLTWSLSLSPVWGQTGDPEEDEEKVTLERADELRKDIGDPHVKKLKNRVIVRHKGSVLYCDSAYLHEDKNAVDAFGNTRLLGDDGTTLTSDSMYYDGETQIARALGDVVLRDEEMTLTTKQLDYNLEEGVAYYYSGGKIVDPEKTLESETGSYDTNSKIFYFKKNVELLSSDGEREIYTDDLTYNTISKLAYFKGPTQIISPDGVVDSNSGTYNTETQVSNFQGRARVEDEDYWLEGDSLFFDNTGNTGFAKGNVRLFSKGDSVMIDGDIGWYKGELGESKVYGNALMRNISEGDTLYLKADTLYSINREEEEKQLMFAYPNPRLFRTEVQGRCDSMVYNRGDSIIHLFGDPVLWNETSQLTSDSMRIELVNNAIHRMHMRMNCYVISEDSLNQFNQIKGKNMQVYFRENYMNRVDIRGNAQNLYFVIEGDSLLVGMNRVDCSDMDIFFREKNQIHRVKYINKADGSLTPPHEIVEPQKRLKNFRLRMEERPTRDEMVFHKEIMVENQTKKTVKNENP